METTTVTEIVKRRARMDFLLDAQSGQTWGEDEIVGCEREIESKLRETFSILADPRGGKLVQLSGVLDQVTI